MKHPIDWHMECLNNMKSYHQSQIEAIRQMQKDVNKILGDIFELERQILGDIFELERQINIAANRGLTEFDRDKLGKKRAKKHDLS